MCKDCEQHRSQSRTDAQTAFDSQLDPETITPEVIKALIEVTADGAGVILRVDENGERHISTFVKYKKSKL